MLVLFLREMVEDREEERRREWGLLPSPQKSVIPKASVVPSLSSTKDAPRRQIGFFSNTQFASKF